jgi:signal transduction histidine kinase
LQILVNLITNAVQATENVRSPRIELETTVDDQLVLIRVRDNGSGISAANMKQLFRFGFTTRTTGHGFGLYSCAVAAQRLDGELTAESNGVGQGACFTLQLPVAAEALVNHSDQGVAVTV